MKIQANEISMNYELSGSGRYFTLIHGAGDNLNVWYNQVPTFSQHYRVLTYDVRGHGQTELPEGELSLDLWVNDLYALLKALDISETILLGYSMGGTIAQGFTLAYPEMVKALILSNSGGGVSRSEEEMRQRKARLQAQSEAAEKDGMEAVIRDRIPGAFSPGFIQKNPQTAQQYKEILLQNDPKGYPRVIQGLLQPAPPSDLSGITCPTLIIVGEHDPYISPAMGRDFQKAIHGSQLKTFSTGHPTALEQPEAYNQTVLKFLLEVGLR